MKSKEAPAPSRVQKPLLPGARSQNSGRYDYRQIPFPSQRGNHRLPAASLHLEKPRPCGHTGKAVVAPEQWRYLSDCNLALIINETVWNVLEAKGREVLLDHELSHFTPPAADKNGNLRWAIREHDSRNSAR